MIKAQAPTRIDLAGGTLDIFPLYLFYERVPVSNISIDLLATTEIIKNDELVLTSVDHDTSQLYTASQAFPELAFHQAVVEQFDLIDEAIQLRTRSSVPFGSGLGGSSALLVSMIKAVSAYKKLELPDQEILKHAQHIETSVIQVPTGTQDYLAALNKGVNCFMYGRGGVELVPIWQDHKEFLQDLVSKIKLIYTGESHFSAQENWKLFQRMINRDHQTHVLFEKIVNNAERILQAIQDEDMQGTIAAASNDWKERKQLLPTMETPIMQNLVDIYQQQEGFLGYRGLGAGAGGAMVVFSESGELDHQITGTEKLQAEIFE